MNLATATDSDGVLSINRPFYYRDILAFFLQQLFGRGTQNRSLNVSGDLMDTGGRFPSTDEFLFRYLDHRRASFVAFFVSRLTRFW